jgi:serine/threonine protein kinase
MADIGPHSRGDLFAQRYVIERVLGEGDRKKTYLARDRKMDREVALSFVKPDAMLLDPEGTEREAKVLGRIGIHDNVVSIFEYEVAPDGSAQYMVFEYLRGGTLAEYLKAHGPLPPSQLLRLGRQLCRGLAHLHASGLIHRDVSPANIWLDDRDVAHLGDFDSAVMENTDPSNLPITTGAFASPEELDGGPLDVRADIYSLGGVLHVAATGKPYPGDGRLLERRADLPVSFASLVLRMLSPQPGARPSGAAEVLAELRAVEHGTEVDMLLAAEESNTIERKASLHHLYGELSVEAAKRIEAGLLTQKQAENQARDGIQKAISKTIAAFLNSHGGTLIIGVTDTGDVVGIEPDFPYVDKQKQNADGWLLSFRNLVVAALDADIWSLINVALVRQEDHLVAIVRVPARSIETWHKEKLSEQFFVRAANSTEPLAGPALIRYIREHFGD